MWPECRREITGDAGGARRPSPPGEHGAVSGCAGTRRHGAAQRAAPMARLLRKQGAGAWLWARALMHGGPATRRAAPAARAPRGPHAGLGGGSLPTASRVCPRWVSGGKTDVQQQRPQSLTGHCCTLVPSTRRRGLARDPDANGQPGLLRADAAGRPRRARGAAPSLSLGAQGFGAHPLTPRTRDGNGSSLYRTDKTQKRKAPVTKT